jgi:hypothetical protein
MNEKAQFKVTLKQYICTYSFDAVDEFLKKTKTKLRGLSWQANYTDRVTAACRRS